MQRGCVDRYGTSPCSCRCEARSCHHPPLPWVISTSTQMHTLSSLRRKAPLASPASWPLWLVPHLSAPLCTKTSLEQPPLSNFISLPARLSPHSAAAQVLPMASVPQVVCPQASPLHVASFALAQRLLLFLGYAELFLTLGLHTGCSLCLECCSLCLECISLCFCMTRRLPFTQVSALAPSLRGSS